MAEARPVEDEEVIRGLREPVRTRNSATDHSEGNKSDHRLSSQGALSSIRAAIRRPLRTSQCNTSRDRSSRRRPEITVLSVEPLSSNPWFATDSGGFPFQLPCSETVWCQRFPEAVQHPPSYEQVIREKRVEENISCAIVPRRAATKTIATQTDVLDNNTAVKEYKSASQSVAKKPQKPPRLPEAHFVSCQTTGSAEAHPHEEPNLVVAQNPDNSSLDSISNSFLINSEQLCVPSEPCKPCSPDTKNCAVGTDQSPPAFSLDSVSDSLSNAEQLCTPAETCKHYSVPVEEPADTKNSSVEGDQSSSTSSLDFTNDPFLSGTEPLCAPAEPCAPCSVRVEEPTRDFPANSGLPKPTCPIPRPRTKPNLQLVNRGVKVQTLVRFKDDGESALVIPCTAEVSSSSYLSDLLDVFGEGELSQSEQRDDSSESDVCDNDCENDNMSTLHSQRNIRARIQAFENQASMDGGSGEPVTKPEPLPRTQQPSPPAVPIKPAIIPKPINRSFLGETPNPKPVPSLAPKPQLPPRNAEDENGLAAVTPSVKATVLPPSRMSVLARANSLMAQGYQPAARRPTPPVLPKPRLDQGSLTNNTAPLPVSSIPGLDDWEATSSAPAKPLRAVQSIPSGPSVSRKPSVIRVPSKPDSTCEDEPQDTLSLPVQWPIGGRVPPVTRKPSITSKLTYQAELQDSSRPEMLSSSVPTLSLPPRPMGGKVLPPRSPPAKVGPGRPPPPKTGGTHRSSFQAATSVSASRQRQSQRISKKGPVLPPRPNPGHALYNKYTLEVPHGIAAFDYNGTNSDELSFQKNEVLLLLEQIDSNTFDCQVGDTRGRVHKSYMKIITPLFNVSGDSELEATSFNQTGRGASSGLEVRALHDFTPESPEELALRVGDTVSNVEEVDSEWYRGTCRGRAGFFPRNYVKVLSTIPPPPASGKRRRPGPSAVSGPRCVARFDFGGEHSDELTFSEGDVIQLKKYVDEEWAEGELGGHTGIFPLNFVKVVEDLPAPPSQQPLPTKTALPGMTSKNQEKHSQSEPSEGEWAVALYDFAAETDQELPLRQGDRVLVTECVDADWCSGKLHGREGLFPTAFVEFCTAPPLDVTEGVQRARALYDFSSQCEEELSMKVGDIITGVESVDHEWFVGELHGQRGLVPKSYIQLL